MLRLTSLVTRFAISEKAAHSFSRSLSEYLREESRDLPTRLETDVFLAKVDALSNDLARAEARVARLRARLYPGSEPSDHS